MNKSIKMALSFIAVAGLMVCSAFAKPKTFEEAYAEKPEVAAALENAVAQQAQAMSDIYAGCRSYAQGNSFVYEFTYNEGIVIEDFATAQKAIDEALKSKENKKSINTAKKAISKEFGVKKLIIKYVYKLFDGTILYEGEF